MDKLKTSKEILDEEILCSFEDFTPSDAKNIGDIILSKSDTVGVVCVEITINGLLVYSHYPTGTSSYNQMWVRRKRNTVDLMQMSSLRMKVELLENGETPADKNLPFENYAICGGGFPIRLKSGTVIGSIVCSNLPDTVDHQIIVDAIKEYKNI